MTALPLDKETVLQRLAEKGGTRLRYGVYVYPLQPHQDAFKLGKMYVVSVLDEDCVPACLRSRMAVLDAADADDEGRTVIEGFGARVVLGPYPVKQKEYVFYIDNLCELTGLIA